MIDIQDLIQASKTDQQALIELWKRLRPIRLRCFNQFPDMKKDYEDLEQEAYFVFNRSIQTYNEDKKASFSTYFYRNLTNDLIDRRRYKATKGQMNLLSEGELFQLETTSMNKNELEEQALFAMRIEGVKMALAQLEEEERDFFIACYLHKKTVQQMSVEMGVPYKRLDSRKRNIMKKVQRILGEFSEKLRI